MVKGGVLFVESADKAARFIQICNSFSLPLLFVADVPGFMVGSAVEKAGIIRAGAKMIHAVSTATVPKISLIVRKAYGAGLYAMCGPAFATDCVLALPTAQIAVMGPQPAVNAVYFNKIEVMSEADKKKFIAAKTDEYEKDVDIFRLASELVVDHMVDFDDVRSEIVARMEFYATCAVKRECPVAILPM
jgi:acetyl-CoA carboxylase carboxyltransferase component